MPLGVAHTPGPRLAVPVYSEGSDKGREGGGVPGGG